MDFLCVQFHFTINHQSKYINTRIKTIIAIKHPHPKEEDAGGLTVGSDCSVDSIGNKLLPHFGQLAQVLRILWPQYGQVGV